MPAVIFWDFLQVPWTLCGRMVVAASGISERHNSVQRKKDCLFGSSGIKVAFPHVSLTKTGSYVHSYMGHWQGKWNSLHWLRPIWFQPWRTAWEQDQLSLGHISGGDYKDKEVENGCWEAINKIHYNLTLQVPYPLLAEIDWSWVYLPSFKNRWSFAFAIEPPCILYAICLIVMLTA